MVLKTTILPTCVVSFLHFPKNQRTFSLRDKYRHIAQSYTMKNTIKDKYFVHFLLPFIALSYHILPVHGIVYHRKYINNVSSWKFVYFLPEIGYVMDLSQEISNCLKFAWLHIDSSCLRGGFRCPFRYFVFIIFLWRK